MAYSISSALLNSHGGGKVLASGSQAELILVKFQANFVLPS